MVSVARLSVVDGRNEVTMNERTVALCLTLAASGALGGCAGASPRTGPAIIAVQTEAGSATEVGGIDKRGRSCSRNILGIVSFGDSSVAKAKADGRITHVASIDHKYTSVIVFHRVCTIVYGT
jgi:hypothetical protein